MHLTELACMFYDLIFFHNSSPPSQYTDTHTHTHTHNHGLLQTQTYLSHASVCDMMAALNGEGVNAILKLDRAWFDLQINCLTHMMTSGSCLCL